MSSIVIQGIGFLALFFVILSFQKKKRIALLLFMLIGLVLFVIHYSLLKAWTGALMNLVEAGVVFVSYKKERVVWAKKKFWPYVFICSYIIAGLITFQTFWDVLPVIAQMFGAIAVWQKNPKHIGMLMLLPRPLWFTYNLIVGSSAGMVTEIVMLISIITGIIRLDV